MRKRTRTKAKPKLILASVAESIGSTLGIIAAKAGAARRAVSESKATKTVEREGKKIARKSRKVARTAERAISRNVGRKKASKGRRRRRA
jgi:hypothetical protein